MSLSLTSNNEQDLLVQLRQEDLLQIDIQIQKLLNELETITPLSEAIAYVMSSPGKRLRPLIAISLLRDMGMNPKEFFPIAIALEIIHTASLVHDDLPALDNDDLRRGRATCHKKFDEATAILVADYMYPWALKIISDSQYSDHIKVNLIGSLNAAYMSLCSGQQLDLLPSDAAKDLVQVAKLKTGALFAACFEFPLIASNASDEAIKTAASIGNRLGLCFQIIDDYLDMFANPIEKGRAESSDNKNNKLTFFSRPESINPQYILTESVEEIQKLILGLLKAEPRIKNLTQTKLILQEVLSRFEPVKIYF